MRNPVIGRVSSEWSRRRVNPATGRVSSHAGIDIAAPIGTPILAAFSGRVLETKKNSYPGDSRAWKGLKSGNFVVIQNTDNAVQWYGHMDRVDVSAGDWVNEGEGIGTVGQTGMVTGPHVHFETWSKNVIASHFNPRVLFNRYGIKPGVDNGGTVKPTAKPKPTGKTYRLLKRGMTGADVRRVAVELRKQGYTNQGATTTYTAQLEANVKDYQRRVGLVIDGKAGELTQKRLGL